MLKKIIIIIILLFIFIYLPINVALNSVKDLVAEGRALQDAAKNENLDEIKQSVEDMKGANSRLNLSLRALFWVRLIPYFGNFYADGLQLSNAAGSELTAAGKLIKTLEPHKAELGFDGNPTPGTDRVAQMVKVLEKVIPELDSVVPEFKEASDEVANIDINKYPEMFGQTRVKSRVATAKNLIVGIHYAVTQARPAIEIAPEALGSPDPKNYLIIFQNDKELRATGGFMTAYAFLKLDKGHVSSSTSDDIYRLDEKLLQTCLNVICPLTPPAPIKKYLKEADGRERTAWSMRDSNISPDVPTSLKTFEKFYSFLPGAEEFDGIILIDTRVVEALIAITGPIEVFGTTYSAEINKECNCSQVVYELERYSQIIERGDADRKAVLGTLMQQILARSLGASTEKLPEFINAGITMANTKHIMVYMHDPKMQDALSGLNWTGEILPTPEGGGYLHINDSNFAGGKTNLYVTEDVTLEINIEKDGTVKNKLTVVYDNPMAHGAWLNTINRDYIRFYVPQGSTLNDSDTMMNSFDELGKTVFETFIEVRPQNKITKHLEYTSPEKVIGNEYNLKIQKQPGTKDHHYVVKINGSKKAEFALDSDRDLKLKF